MMADHSQPTEILAKLNDLVEKLGSEHDQDARREAIRLSRDLTLSLDKPENTAVDLAFSVCVRFFEWL